MRYFLFSFILILSFSANAETYLGIGPMDTLGNVQQKFPNAKFSRTFPAWIQSPQALYRLEGAGIAGRIVLSFIDFRPGWRELAGKSEEPETVARYKLLSELPDADALGIQWVRWIPSNRVPLQRLLSKYGLPEISGFSDEDYKPYRAWEKAGVTAALSDDEKFVEIIDFSFTRDDHRKAYLEKKLPLPDWLVDAPAAVTRGKGQRGQR
jgi:hypothetical protein